MKALIPDTAAWTTHLAFSTARSWLISRCWREAAVMPYDALLVVTTRNSAPSATSARSIDGKLFSKQMTLPNVSPSTCRGCTRWPGVSSYGICRNAEIHESQCRNGTYSPNGTR